MSSEKGISDALVVIEIMFVEVALTIVDVVTFPVRLIYALLLPEGSLL